MAISDEQRLFRAERLGSSDATRLMAGDWRALWEEKTGRVEPPCLDFVPRVQIGIATEPLHAAFYTHRTGVACRLAEGTLVHPEFDFIVAHLDFLTWRRPEDEGRSPCDTLVEAKFTAGFKSDPELVQHYHWQIQHQLLVSGLPYAVLSILRPSSYSLLPVERSERDMAKLLDSLHAFWWYVENDIEPPDPEPMAAPAVTGARVLDMSRHNEFAAWGGILAENEPGMRAYRDAENALKALMPADAQVAFLPGTAGEGRANEARGIFLTRSSDGKLALRFGDLPRRHRAKLEPWEPGAVPADSLDEF
ncbi:MAG TPA: YqaJ viral recombinase family protein [Steroidobacteraceae bacterium]|nr:YqaJ viral recombinase family protein [Steroidobacteraceae bacterium]